MRKIITLALVVCVLALNVLAFAASDKAMQNASDEAVFHRVGDWFATIGKADTEKQTIIAQRKMTRAAKKAEKMAKKQAEETKKKMNDMKKSFGK